LATNDDRKIKRIKLTVTKERIEKGNGCFAEVYHIQMRAPYNKVFDYIATSKEHLEIVLNGINMTLAVMGVLLGGVPTDIKAPFEMEIKCFKGHVSIGFE